MPAQFQIRNPESQTGSQQSAPSQFADLDSKTQRLSFVGLAAAASIYAGAYAVVFLADWFTQIAADNYFHFPPLFDSVVAVLAVGYATFLAIRLRFRPCDVCDFAPMAMAFLVVSALGIAAQSWGWESRELAIRFSMATVNWVGLWIVAFPGVVTLPPRQVLIASLFAAATVPAVTSLSLVVHGFAPEAGNLPWVAVVRHSIPVFISVGIAYISARHVFHLARDVSHARRLGSYQLRDKIGAGGMGEVWRAKHRLLARPAAVKLIRPESLGENGSQSGVPIILRRFEREAQATAQLTSPHSIVLYDFGIAEDGAFYYVMELLDGRDLKTVVQTSGPMPAERVVHVLRAVCDSLADAHYRGLVHRDVKPANIFTCRRGREFDFVKVLDFGLVKTVQESGEASTQLTGANATSGTPGFMAPELVTGDRPIDGRADLYSLGCVGYWLLTGQLVFDGKNALAILVQHVRETPPPISSRTEIEVPPRLEEILASCLAKDPDDRPASAQELGEMLAELADTLPTWTHDRAEKWWRTHLPNLYAAPVGGNLESSPSVANG